MWLNSDQSQSTIVCSKKIVTFPSNFYASVCNVENFIYICDRFLASVSKLSMVNLSIHNGNNAGRVFDVRLLKI